VSRPVLLDLFCGAGGAAMGYHQAGFDVVGVDIKPQPRYPFRFVQGDALDVLAGWDLVPAYAGVHASPPCHDHSNVTGRNRKAKGPKGTGWMLGATVRRLRAIGVPWVVENVETAEWAPEDYRLRLCGSSIGLDVRRHRWFATNVPMMAPPCAHHWQRPRFRSLDSRRPEGALATVVGVHGHLNYAGEFELRCRAMGIDWMTNEELSQAIPPAYTRFIGEQLLAYLCSEVAS
jgi:DNA (cytosine-5)-methyltransferase 1